MRTPLRAAICVGAVLVTGQLACAAERQLAGIRLDQLALNLLTIPVYGIPDYIAPVGVTTVVPLQPEPTAGPVLEQAPGAPQAPAVGAVGMGAMGGMGGPMGRMGGPMGRMGGLGPMGGLVQPTAAVQQPAAALPAAQAGPEPLVYWMYRLPKATRVIVGIRPDGTVASVTLQGRVAGPEHTSRGIRLGDSYLRVISAYQYPDRTASVGGGLALSYEDLDVRFLLQGMRVSEIHIGELPSVISGAAAPAGAAQLGGGAGPMGRMGGMGGPMMGRMGGLMGHMGGPMGRMAGPMGR